MEIQGLCPLIQVFDMKTSLSFYCEILEFKIHQSAGEKDGLGWAWLKWNNAQHRPEKPDDARIAAHDDTTLYFGCPDVDQAYQTLLSKGLKLSQPIITSYGMKQLYFHDPDGYNLCFQWSAS